MVEYLNGTMQSFVYKDFSVEFSGSRLSDIYNIHIVECFPLLHATNLPVDNLYSIINALNTSPSFFVVVYRPSGIYYWQALV